MKSIAAVAVFVLLRGTPLVAADLPFSLDAALAANQPEVILPIGGDRTASIGILRGTADAKTTVVAMLSPFVDAQNRPVRIALVLADGTLDVVTPPLTIDRVLRLQLKAPA